MKLVSWNVNGLRACIQKGFLEQFDRLDADFFCLQETKLSEGQLTLELPGYEQYWCYADKKGYSGTAIFTKHSPVSVRYGLDVPELDSEGRLITLEYKEFYLVNCYTPNAQRGLARIGHRLKWDEAFRAYLQKLDAEKPVILCGDLNVAHQEIDLKNPKSNRGSAGFSDEERESFQKTLDLGFTDTFRHLHPDATGCYSWWSYMFHARENNAGWRIDYFLVSDRLKDAVYQAEICSDILGSDHCPVSLSIDLTCNGGIWSPMSLGKAKIQGTEKTEPGASAVKAKALAAIAALCVVVLSAGLFWGIFRSLPEPEQPDLFDVYVYDVPLSTYSINAALSSGNSTVGDPNESYDYFLHDDGLYKTASSVDAVTYRRANVWLRVELNSEGLAAYDPSWTLELLSEAVGSSDSTLAILEYTELTGEAGGHTAGWLVFARIGAEEDYTLRLHCGEGAYTESVRLSPYQGTERDDLIYTMSIYSRITSMNPNFATGTVIEDQPDTLILCQEGIWFTTAEPSLPVSDARYGVVVTPTRILSNQVDPRSASLDVMAGGEPIGSSEGAVISLYSDLECQNFVGWLIYGYQTDISELEITASANNGTDIISQTVTVGIVPYIAEDEAREMSTKALVEYVINHPGIAQQLENTLNEESVPTYMLPIEDDVVINLPIIFNIFPALNELRIREDAVEKLMNCTPSTDSECRNIPNLLLNMDAFRRKMTPQEEASYVTGEYPASPYVLLLDPDTPENYLLPTHQLVTWIHDRYEAIVTVHLNECSTEEARGYVYQILQEYYPILTELEHRENVLDELAAAAVTCTNYSCLMSEILEVWEFAPEQLSTETLVNYVVRNDRILQQLTGSLILTNLPEDPFLQELAAREDAVAALMNCELPTQGRFSATPYYILNTDEIRAKMTPREEVDFLTMNYNSHPFERFPMDPYSHVEDPEECTTDYLVEQVMLCSTLHAELMSKCSTTEAQQLLYRYIRAYSPTLWELETREDAVDCMKRYCDSSQNLNDPGLLPYLLDLWPYIQSIRPENLSTADLVAAIMENDVLCESIAIIAPGSDRDTYYADLIASTPELRELFTRADAVDALMNCEKPAHFPEVPSYLLGVDAMYRKMTPRQEAEFLMDLYPSSHNEFTYQYGWSGIAYQSFPTRQLLNELYGDHTLWGRLGDCSSLEAMQEVYLIARPYNPLLRELETREDALAEMEALNALEDTYYYLKYMLDLWPFISTLDELPPTN